LAGTSVLLISTSAVACCRCEPLLQWSVFRYVVVVARNCVSCDLRMKVTDNRMSKKQFYLSRKGRSRKASI
jgi:hypothetical protein